ncbi:MAG: efflux RND transporter periplasmic adaptor subunit [Vicinamibacterales bacterium]
MTYPHHRFLSFAGRASWLFGLFAACCSFLVTACGGDQSQPQAGGPAGGAPPGIPVTVRTVEPGAVNDTSEYIATLKAVRSTSVRPQVEGYILAVPITSGARVAPGTALFRIDPARQQATVASQEASVAAREADLAYARQQYDRMKNLFDQRVVSKAELDGAETAFKTAESALAAIEAQVHEQNVELQYYVVRATTSGMIGDIPVRVGDRVTPDTELTTIDSNDQLEVLLPVPAERSTDLKTGLPLELLGPDGTVLERTLATFVSPRVESDTQSVLVKAIVANASGALRSQQFVRTRVIWASRQGITVPVLAVTRISGQPFVFVAETQSGGLVARQRPVKLGPITGDTYAVVDGLQAGDRVVVSGVQKLADGAPIAAQG